MHLTHRSIYHMVCIWPIQVLSLRAESQPFFGSCMWLIDHLMALISQTSLVPQAKSTPISSSTEHSAITEFQKQVLEQIQPQMHKFSFFVISKITQEFGGETEKSIHCASIYVYRGCLFN